MSTLSRASLPGTLKLSSARSSAASVPTATTILGRDCFAAATRRTLLAFGASGFFPPQAVTRAEARRSVGRRRAFTAVAVSRDGDGRWASAADGGKR